MTTKTLAWHETMELHELIAAQSVGLVKIKKSINQRSSVKTALQCFSEGIGAKFKGASSLFAKNPGISSGGRTGRPVF